MSDRAGGYGYNAPKYPAAKFSTTFQQMQLKYWIFSLPEAFCDTQNAVKSRKRLKQP